MCCYDQLFIENQNFEWPVYLGSIDDRCNTQIRDHFKTWTTQQSEQLTNKLIQTNGYLLDNRTEIGLHDLKLKADMEEDSFMPKMYLINWIGLTVWMMKAYVINGGLDHKMETWGDLSSCWTMNLRLTLESRATWLMPWRWSWWRRHGRPWLRRTRI